MKTKNTPWINILAVPIIVASLGLAGSTTVADHCNPADVNESGQVNIDDLLLVIEDRGEECYLGEHDAPAWQWARGDYPHVTVGSSTQSHDDTGSSIIVFDHDGGDMKDFKVNTSKLLNGPGESSHKLRVTITVDFSNYRRTNADFDFATPVFFLTGYKLDGYTTPRNYNTSTGHYFYGDRIEPSDNSACAPPLPNGNNNVTVAELDLFEIGSASNKSTTAEDDGLMNLMQITTHPPLGDDPSAGDCNGTYIGLRHDDVADYAGGECSIGDQLLTTANRR